MKVFAWIVIVGGVGWVLWTFGMFWNSGDRAEAYEKSPVCPYSQPAPTCRHKLSAVVATKNHTFKNRMHRYSMTVRASDNAVHDAAIGKENYEAISVGQTIEVERWEDHVTKIYRDGKAIELPQTPKASRPVLMLSIASLVALAGLLWVLLARLRNRKQRPITNDA